MIHKHGAWSCRDIYGLPIALCLWPLVSRNYFLREIGELPDKWYWADVIMLHFGYWVRG